MIKSKSDLKEYLLERKQIKSLIQFIDARHDVQKNDLQMREWVEAYNLPIFTIVTKIDYVPRSKVQKVIAEIGATSMKDMGNVMKEAKSEIGTAADGKSINDVVKELLG